MEAFILGNPFTRGFISAVPQKLASLLYSNVDVWEGSSCFLAELLCSGEGLGGEVSAFSI